MATTKVSQLAALTTPDGAEELLINDGGTSKKITIANAIIAGTGITKSGATISASPVALTTVQTAANQTAHLALTAQEGDVVVRSDENKTYMHNGGSAGDMNDYTLLATPTDAVTSVGGNTGVVTDAQIAASVEAASDSNTFTDADHSKLNAIEASADVTDATNVTAAGALMDSEVTNLAQVKAFDSSDYATAAQGTLATNALPKSGGTMTGNISHAGAFTIDTVGDLSLDSEGAIIIKNGGSAIGRISNSSSNMIIKSDTSDKDILFKGNDGGSVIEAMRIDMSAGGKVGIGETEPLGYLHVKNGDSGQGSVNAAGDSLVLESDGSTGITFLSGSSSNTSLIMGDSESNYQGVIIYDHSVNAFKFATTGTERLRIDNSGNIGINTTSPSKTLAVHSTSGSAGTPNGLYLYNEVHGSDSQIYMYAENDSGTNKGATIKLDPDAETFSFTGTGGQTAITIDDSGNVDMAGSITADGLTVDGDVVIQKTTGDVSLTLAANENSGAREPTIFLKGYSTNSNPAIQFGDNNGYPGSIQYENQDNSMRFAVNGGEEMRLESDGDLHVDGDVIAYSTTISDERLKDNIKVVDSALDKVKELKGVTFTRKQDGVKSAGVIAQDVEKVLPEAVKHKALPLHTGDDELFKTVQYDALHALLIEAVKELSEKVEKLENK